MAAMKPIEYGRSDTASPARMLPEKYVRCAHCTDGHGSDAIRYRETGKPVPFETVAKEGLKDTLESHGTCNPCAKKWVEYERGIRANGAKTELGVQHEGIIKTSDIARNLPDEYVRCSFCKDGNPDETIRYKETGKPVPMDIVEREGLRTNEDVGGICSVCEANLKRLRDEMLKKRNLTLEDIRRTRVTDG